MIVITLLPSILKYQRYEDMRTGNNITYVHSNITAASPQRANTKGVGHPDPIILL